MSTKESVDADVVALQAVLPALDSHRRAATCLLIDHDYWLRREDFRRFALNHTTHGAYIRWHDLQDALAEGAFGNAASSERTLLEVAVMLGTDTHQLMSLGTAHRRSVITALTTALTHS